MVEELPKALVLSAIDLEGCKTFHRLAKVWIMRLQRKSPKMAISPLPQKEKLSVDHRKTRKIIQFVKLHQIEKRVVELLLLSRQKVIDPKVKLLMIQRLEFKLQLELLFEENY